MTVYKKILIGLLILNLLGGCYLLYRAVTNTEYRCNEYNRDCGDRLRPDLTAAAAAIVVTAVSLFLPLLLLTLIDHIERLEAIVNSLHGRLIRLEQDAGLLPPPVVSRSAERSSAQQTGLSNRLGKL